MTARPLMLAFALSLFADAGAAGELVARGEFVGKSNHETRGEARLERDGAKWVVHLGDDFFHDGAPDPKVALGRDGYREDAILAPLASLTGAQSYEVPAGIDAAAFNEVWIWCQRFNVPLGQARLN